MRTLNLNDWVRIKINFMGERMLSQKWHSVPARIFYNLKESEDGWIRLQLWEVFQYFGSYDFSDKTLLPFGTEIRLEDDHSGTSS